MTSIPFGERGVCPSAPTALLIDPALPRLLAALPVLASMGFDVTVAETFQDAKHALAVRRPAVLVTGLKLQEYNGLHLVLRGTATWSGLPCIVTSDKPDAVLQQEAERLGATFVVMPTSHEELAAAVCRTVLRTEGTFSLIRPPFERRRRNETIRLTKVWRIQCSRCAHFGPSRFQ